MYNFKCEVCGQNHDIYNNINTPIPSILTDLSVEEYKKRVQQIDIFYMIDNSYVLTKGNLTIGIKNSKYKMNWEAWVSIKKIEFIKKMNQLSNKVAFFSGELYSEIPFYEKANGVSIKLVYDLEIVGKYPNIEVLEKSTELFLDQKNNLSKEKLSAWMEQLYHS